MIIKRTLLPYKHFHAPEKPFFALSQKQFELISEFNRRVKDGNIELVTTVCLCGSMEFDLVASVDRYTFQQKTVICRVCGLMQSNPRMTEREYSRFYSSDIYRLCYEGEDYILSAKKRYSLNYGEDIFREINRIRGTDQKVSILEFGAGGGWNLLPFIKAGAKTMGIDYSKSLVALGASYGIPMKEGGIEQIDEKYDIIILNHVIEHFINPVETLRMISAHLNESGLLYIASPDINNFSMGQLQNAHTYYFNPKTLKYYCSNTNLQCIAFGRAQNVHMFGIFKLSRKPLKQPDINTYKSKSLLALFFLIRAKRFIKKILSEYCLIRFRN